MNQSQRHHHVAVSQSSRNHQYFRFQGIPYRVSSNDVVRRTSDTDLEGIGGKDDTMRQDDEEMSQ